MRFKVGLAILLPCFSFITFAQSPTTEGRAVNDSSTIAEYTIEEGDSFGFYVGIPASLPYQNNASYKTKIINKNENLILSFKNLTLKGIAPDVEKTESFWFSTETYDENNPSSVAKQNFKITVLNK